ncbi:TOBE domain-containing protein [Corynebacterium doosanense]|uniref:MerR family transcriptional regulator n=1 Tax=Corynebacterium doosanense CAU 212 = DSM 45436 TaxID=558173 RepID=A0A097IHG0_9CORY|nr:TOBE domain-containing protein [Corynebacterium doosanense]AIT61548.1 MerR family transcriptional regulator [Corynebacterium doosanense CAU 212 = DSM 45436]
MPAIRIKTAAILLGVSDDTVRRWVSQGKLQSTDGGVDGASLAAFANERARDQALGDPASQEIQSARNQLTGLVTRITSDTVMSQVELQCGPYRVVSLISTEAVRDLGLEVGSVATAGIKATNVTVSLPDGTR